MISGYGRLSVRIKKPQKWLLFAASFHIDLESVILTILKKGGSGMYSASLLFHIDLGSVILTLLKRGIGDVVCLSAIQSPKSLGRIKTKLRSVCKLK